MAAAILNKQRTLLELFTQVLIGWESRANEKKKGTAVILTIRRRDVEEEGRSIGMSSLDRVVSEFRDAAQQRGSEWLQEQLRDLLHGVAGQTERKRSLRRTRPPQRLSPGSPRRSSVGVGRHGELEGSGASGPGGRGRQQRSVQVAEVEGESDSDGQGAYSGDSRPYSPGTGGSQGGPWSSSPRGDVDPTLPPLVTQRRGKGRGFRPGASGSRGGLGGGSPPGRRGDPATAPSPVPQSGGARGRRRTGTGPRGGKESAGSAPPPGYSRGGSPGTGGKGKQPAARATQRGAQGCTGRSSRGGVRSGSPLRGRGLDVAQEAGPGSTCMVRARTTHLRPVSGPTARVGGEWRGRGVERDGHRGQRSRSRSRRSERGRSSRSRSGSHSRERSRRSTTARRGARAGRGNVTGASTPPRERGGGRRRERSRSSMFCRHGSSDSSGDRDRFGEARRRRPARGTPPGRSRRSHGCHASSSRERTGVGHSSGRSKGSSRSQSIGGSGRELGSRPADVGGRVSGRRSPSGVQMVDGRTASRGLGRGTADRLASLVTVPEVSTAKGPGGELRGVTQGAGQGGDTTTLLHGLKHLIADWESQGPGAVAGPSRVWGSGANVAVSEGRGLPAAVGVALGGCAGTDSAPGDTGVADKGDSEREVLLGVAETARQNAYVAFAGPLGVHVKREVKEKIWKGEFVELFSLLPLDETIELKDEDKKDKKKEEEEKKKRYSKLPQTFGNWLRAFCILASIIGEKHPEKCSSLFCYVDGVWEAFKVYGGLAWWRYDEQFRQRLAANPTMRWDQMDITLWLKLMMAQKTSPFQRGAGGGSRPPLRPRLSRDTVGCLTTATVSLAIPFAMQMCKLEGAGGQRRFWGRSRLPHRLTCRRGEAGTRLRRAQLHSLAIAQPNLRFKNRKFGS
ncbi:hypothetical protein XELAEV_18038513mg [Xenopus laevis]|uniref:Uncharacterized protein n=1 Tax=Xenopus laevis TaxID=8355 RepID=A0A974C7E5_XENLA|nr:hypothetical protein XELAEV_18038513mg [Xenopus laevis]